MDAFTSYGMAEMAVDRARRLLELDLLRRHGAVREFELQIVPPDGKIRTVLDTTQLANSLRLRKVTLRGDTLRLKAGRRLAVRISCPDP